MSVSYLVTERVSATICGREVIQTKAVHGHGTTFLHYTVSLAAVIYQVVFQEVRKERCRKDEIHAVVIHWKRIVTAQAGATPVDFACLGRSIKLEPLRVEILTTPFQHFIIDVDADVLSCESL